jgi:hypothetical protein
MHIFLSNYWWQRSDIWSQASYRYPISWEAFLDPSDSYFLLAYFVDFYTHWTYMHIFRHIFLSNYWWQRSDIWSQASYRYPISWEACLDPSDSYFLFDYFVDFSSHWTTLLVMSLHLDTFSWLQGNYKMNCELMLTYDTPALRQTGRRNLMGQKNTSHDMGYLYKACDQISDLCRLVIRKMCPSGATWLAASALKKIQES